MRNFSYENLPQDLLAPDIMNLVSAIHEYKGKQDLYIQAKPDVLEKMLNVAKVQSTVSSNRIEGIYTSDERIDALMKAKATPHNRSEREILGYREVLTLIHENYEYMIPRPNVLLQLHRDLYQYDISTLGGVFKSMDNSIIERDEQGNEKVRFQPVSAFETPQAIEELTSSYLSAVNARKYDPLLLISMFIFDFVSIHPFNDGNGRMSRLLTLLLLYRADYLVGKYISLEMIIENTKEGYYEALGESSAGWHENKSSYYPFVKYYLEIILRAYKEFGSRVELITDRMIAKTERIRLLFDQTPGKLTKKEILARFPDISQSTVDKTLIALQAENYILKVGGSKNTSYIKNNENI